MISLVNNMRYCTPFDNIHFKFYTGQILANWTFFYNKHTSSEQKIVPIPDSHSKPYYQICFVSYTIV